MSLFYPFYKVVNTVLRPVCMFIPNTSSGVKAHGTVSSGTEDFSLLDGKYHTITAGGDFAFTISDWPDSGELGVLEVEAENFGAHTVTPPTLVCAGDVNPFTSGTLTASGKDTMLFWSMDGGTTVYYRLTGSGYPTS